MPIKIGLLTRPSIKNILQKPIITDTAYLKFRNDNLNTIKGITYVIVPNNDTSADTSASDDTSADTSNENNIKVSNIQQKEYIINISNFETLVNPANEIFYTQNTFYETSVKPNVYERTMHKRTWALSNRFL